LFSCPICGDATGCRWFVGCELDEDGVKFLATLWWLDAIEARNRRSYGSILSSASEFILLFCKNAGGVIMFMVEMWGVCLGMCSSLVIHVSCVIFCMCDDNQSLIDPEAPSSFSQLLKSTIQNEKHVFLGMGNLGFWFK